MKSDSMTKEQTPLSGKNRAIMLGGCCLACASLIPVALYQTDVIPRLYDPPFAIFNSERITKSEAAFPFGVPDGLLGLASFGATLALILASRRSVTARRLLGVKLAADACAAMFNATRQVVMFRELCSWCTATALSTGVMSFAGRDIIEESAAEAKTMLKEKVSSLNR